MPRIARKPVKSARTPASLRTAMPEKRVFSAGFPPLKPASDSSAPSGKSAVQFRCVRSSLWPSRTRHGPRRAAAATRDAFGPEGPNRLSLRNACDVAGGVYPPQAGNPRIVGNSLRQFPLSRSRLQSPLPGRPNAWRGLQLQPSTSTRPPKAAVPFVSVRVHSWLLHAERFRGASRSPHHPCASVVKKPAGYRIAFGGTFLRMVRGGQPRTMPKDIPQRPLLPRSAFFDHGSRGFHG